MCQVVPETYGMCCVPFRTVFLPSDRRQRHGLLLRNLGVASPLIIRVGPAGYLRHWLATPLVTYAVLINIIKHSALK